VALPGRRAVMWEIRCVGSLGKSVVTRAVCENKLPASSLGMLNVGIGGLGPVLGPIHPDGRDGSIP